MGYTNTREEQPVKIVSFNMGYGNAREEIQEIQCFNMRHANTREEYSVKKVLYTRCVLYEVWKHTRRAPMKQCFI